MMRRRRDWRNSGWQSRECSWLLGMLLGVWLGLLDERDWGALDRVRALSGPAGNVLLGKLGSRFVVGVVQMLVMFAVGYLLFGISLGPQPWALLLPIAGIGFAGTGRLDRDRRRAHPRLGVAARLDRDRDDGGDRRCW